MTWQVSELLAELLPEAFSGDAASFLSAAWQVAELFAELRPRVFSPFRFAGI